MILNFKSQNFNWQKLTHPSDKEKDKYFFRSVFACLFLRGQSFLEFWRISKTLPGKKITKQVCFHIESQRSTTMFHGPLGTFLTTLHTRSNKHILETTPN